MALGKRRSNEPQANDPDYGLSPGTFTADGSWRPADEGDHPGPIRDDRWRFIDSLVAVRRQTHRQLPPRDFARFVREKAPLREPVFGYHQITPELRIPTLDAWKVLYQHGDWQIAPTPTSAARCVRDAGFGHEAHKQSGIGLILPDDGGQIDPDQARFFLADLERRFSIPESAAEESRLRELQEQAEQVSKPLAADETFFAPTTEGS